MTYQQDASSVQDSSPSDPPALSPADLERIRQESGRLGAAYLRRTASMERLTGEDMRRRCRYLRRPRFVDHASPSPAIGVRSK